MLKKSLLQALLLTHYLHGEINKYKEKEQIEMLRMNLQRQHLLFLPMMMEMLEPIQGVE